MGGRGEEGGDIDTQAPFQKLGGWDVFREGRVCRGAGGIDGAARGGGDGGKRVIGVLWLGAVSGANVTRGGDCGGVVG